MYLTTTTQPKYAAVSAAVGVPKFTCKTTSQPGATPYALLTNGMKYKLANIKFQPAFTKQII